MCVCIAVALITAPVPLSAAIGCSHANQADLGMEQLQLTLALQHPRPVKRMLLAPSSVRWPEFSAAAEALQLCVSRGHMFSGSPQASLAVTTVPPFKWPAKPDGKEGDEDDGYNEARAYLQ